MFVSSPLNEQEDTRVRLIHAAAVLFAAKGLAGTSVREITDLAQTNLASVNYHFASKDQLYVETLRHMFLGLGDMHQQAKVFHAAAANDPNDPAAARTALRSFIRMFVTGVAGTGPHFDLMLREMVEPTGALPEIFREFILPQAAILAELVQFVQPALRSDPARLQSYCESIVAQCLHVRQQQNTDRALDLPPPTPEHIQRKADFIADFSLKALE